MVTGFIHYGMVNKEYELQGVHWSGFHDYFIPCKSFASNYSISSRKMNRIGAAVESIFNLMRNALLVKYVFVYVL